MHTIEQGDPSDHFQTAWLAAARHINSQCIGGINWLRTSLRRPFIEHLSFRIGNQLFFVFVEAAEIKLSARCDSFVSFSNLAGAIPCVMPMRNNIANYEPCEFGWGLVHAVTKQLIDPLGLVSEELIEMSDWEVHDFAVNTVMDRLEKEGKTVFSTCSDMEINPSLWFEEKGLNYWVVIREARHPETYPEIPSNISKITASVEGKAEAGYFASVVVANYDDPFDPEARTNGNFLTLYRGHPIAVKYEGIQPLARTH